MVNEMINYYKIACIVFLCSVCLFITSCSYLLDAAKGISGMLGSTNNGQEINASLKMQNGNNSNKVTGSDFNDNEIERSNISGKDQYHASNITIHHSNFFENIFSVVVGMIIAFIFFWSLKPHPVILVKKIKNLITCFICKRKKIKHKLLSHIQKQDIMIKDTKKEVKENE